MRDPEKNGASSAATDEAPGGIQALPARVARYETARKRALDVAQYIRAHHAEELGRQASKLEGCGGYLLFRHYFTVDSVRLHAASFCKSHLLCAFCAIRRGAKCLDGYLTRYEAIRLSQPALRPFLVTLTVKDGPDLLERFRHLRGSFQRLWKRRQGTRQSTCLSAVQGAVWSYELKRGQGSGQWHPHVHAIMLANEPPSARTLSAEWHEITGDSFIVDVRPIEEDDLAGGFAEVFKYAVKFSDMDPADTVHAFRELRGCRLIDSAGCFRGVEIPAALADEPLDDLPFVALLYRFIRGTDGRPGGYSLVYQSTPLPPDRRRLVSRFTRIMCAPSTSRGYGAG